MTTFALFLLQFDSVQLGRGLGLRRNVLSTLQGRVMANVRIGLVETKPLLEGRLIVEVQRQPGMVESARTVEGTASLDFEHVVTAVAILVDPSSDRITHI